MAYSPTKDNLIDSAAPTSNYGTTTGLQVGYISKGTHVCRSLLEFDISDIPVSSRITAASLDLYCITASTAANGAKLSRITRTDWVEAESTWNIYKTGSNWTTAGGDYDISTPPAVPFNLPIATGAFSISGESLVIWVQDAFDSRSGICEMMLRVDSETTAGIAVFGSKEHATVAYRPVLTVSYTAPGVRQGWATMF